MQTQKTKNTNQKQGSVNPFARALAETEQSSFTDQLSNQDGGNPFRDALAKTGGNLGDFPENMPFGQDQQLRAQEEAKEKAEQQRLLKQRHDTVNPVNQVDVFSKKEIQVKRMIDDIRQELSMLVGEAKKFEKEVDLTLFKEVVHPGQTGTYYLNFFHNLRAFIILLRKKIKSARTWATQNSSIKSKKKKRSGKPGLEVAGGKKEKTSTVHDMMHHESNAVYAGA